MSKYAQVLEKYKYSKGDHLTKEIKANSDISEQKNIINKIVLWKTNRTPEIKDGTINKLLKIQNLKSLSSPDEINEVKILLNELLNSKGVRIAMASAILHFYNP